MTMNLWSFNGIRVSIFVRPRTDPAEHPNWALEPQRNLGWVLRNEDGTWSAYDCTRPNDLGTSSLLLGVKPTREEAKLLVESMFPESVAEDADQDLKAEFT